METLWDMYHSPEVTSSLTFSAMMEMLVSVKFPEHARLDSGVGLGVEVQCVYTIAIYKFYGRKSHLQKLQELL